MIVSIHQPSYLPWLGYFDKIAKSDIHIFLDDAEYSKNDFFNRNKIKTPHGTMWLTIPIKHKSNMRICETKIDNTIDWRKKHWKAIKADYSGAPYFREYSHIFEEFYMKSWVYLSDITISMNRTICELIGINAKFVKSSELKAGGKKNEKLINLCRAVGADIYLSGQGARSYMDDTLFQKENISIIYQDFIHPVYNQLFGTFVPNLSVIDFLFNCGVEKIKKLW